MAGPASHVSSTWGCAGQACTFHSQLWPSHLYLFLSWSLLQLLHLFEMLRLPLWHQSHLLEKIPHHAFPWPATSASCCCIITARADFEALSFAEAMTFNDKLSGFLMDSKFSWTIFWSNSLCLAGSARDAWSSAADMLSKADEAKPEAGVPRDLAFALAVDFATAREASLMDLLTMFWAILSAFPFCLSSSASIFPSSESSGRKHCNFKPVTKP